MFLGFYDFWTWHQKVIFGPPSPSHHHNGNLGFYDFWTQHQKVIFGPLSPSPLSPPPTIMGIWDFMIFGLSIKK